MKIESRGEIKKFDDVDPGTIFISQGSERSQLFLKLKNMFGAVAFSEAPNPRETTPSLVTVQAFKNSFVFALPAALIIPVINLETIEFRSPNSENAGAYAFRANGCYLLSRRDGVTYEIDLQSGEVAHVSNVNGQYWCRCWNIVLSSSELDMLHPLLRFQVPLSA